MAQGYYTLDEAAIRLAMAPDELKAMARRGEIRAFQDRGTALSLAGYRRD